MGGQGELKERYYCSFLEHRGTRHMGARLKAADYINFCTDSSEDRSEVFHSLLGNGLEELKLYR